MPFFAALEERWSSIDFVIHAIGFSDKEELKGRYADTTRTNFLRTLDISCFSFTDICRRAAKLMPNGGSLLTLTYYGAEKVMPNYNVMGVAKAALEASVQYLAVDLGRDNIRVNGISYGPVKTLAANGISDFRYILKWEPIQFAAEAQRLDGRCRRRRPLYGERSQLRRYRRNPSCRLRLPCRRHEVDRRAGYLRRLMAGNSFGSIFRFTTWGESHGPAIGCVVDGVPPRVALARGGYPALASTGASPANRASPPSGRKPMR